MLRLILFTTVLYGVSAYFTLLGQCPQDIKLQEEFRLADFLGKWYQAYHYSSDGRQRSNCTTIELKAKGLDGIFLNQSRVDRGLFSRYSIGKLELPISIEDAADMAVTFEFESAPRRLRKRRYPFRVLATNYKYYATVYSCQYSPLIGKHFIYVYLLSRQPILNDVSKELAMKPLHQLGITEDQITKDDRSKCNPKYFEDRQEYPLTFNYPVPVGF